MSVLINLDYCPRDEESEGISHLINLDYCPKDEVSEGIAELINKSRLLFKR